MTELARRVDAVVDGALAAERIVGAVVLVSVDGVVVHRRAGGLDDREADIAMRDDAVFRLASVSKLLVATTAMVLVGRGRLGLDDRVDRWLPEFRPRLADGSAATITVRHLLTHTAGLGYGFLEPPDRPYHRAGVSDGLDGAGLDGAALTLDENMRRLASVPLLFEPGTAWTYSLSIDVLGAVVERAAGQTLPAAVRDLLTEPQGLSHTGFSVTRSVRLALAYADATPRPRRMSGADHFPAVEGLAPLAADLDRAYDDLAFPSGGGGMVGTADDTLRVLETLRRGGAPILPDGLTAEMARNQTGTLSMADWPGWSYGLGFAMLRDAAGTPETPGTWRWGGAYGHTWFVDPAKRLSVVAFTNTASEGVSGRFPQDVTRAIYAALS